MSAAAFVWQTYIVWAILLGLLSSYGSIMSNDKFIVYIAAETIEDTLVLGDSLQAAEECLLQLEKGGCSE